MDGKSGEDAVNEMLYNDDVNTIDSIIKIGIDVWYQKYLANYEAYLEDAIFCNDRSQSNATINGWNPNGGRIETGIEFLGSNNLSCLNETDQFSISNPKAQLTYKIGLMSYREMLLVNQNSARVTGESYWILGPYTFRHYVYHDANCYYVYSSGGFGISYTMSIYGVRPAISLRPETEYMSGDGTMANPYIVKMD